MPSSKKKADAVSKSFVIPGYQQMLWLVVAIGFIALVANIYASQFMPNFYYKMVSGNRQGAVEFYRQARELKSFSSIRQESGATVAGYNDEILAEDRRRDALIVELESLLQVNPKAKDVLRTLVILYTQRGDEAKAQEYRLQLEQVDPTSDLQAL